MRRLSRQEVAWRAAQDIENGRTVNLGIGLPTLVANHVPEGRELMLHSENGLIGFGPAPAPGEEDPDLINAGKELVTIRPGGSYFHHNDAFVMIRGGHIDLSLMGAFEVSAAGDLANWTTGSTRFPPGVGGAMDLAVGAREVWVLVGHTTKDGRPRILKECTLPLTARGVVRRIYTDLAVMRIEDGAVVVEQIVEGGDLAALQAVTEANLVADPSMSVLKAGLDAEAGEPAHAS